MDDGVATSPIETPPLGLTTARERAGLSLQQAADQLHLDVSSVKALEAGDFAALGAQVYARGHLRRYAELLGLPEGTVEAACAKGSAPERNTELTRTPTTRQRGAAGDNALRLPPGAAAVAAGVLVVLAIVWWAMRSPRSARAPPALPASAATVGAEDAPGADAAKALGPATQPGAGGPPGVALELAHRAATLGDADVSGAAARLGPVDPDRLFELPTPLRPAESIAPPPTPATRAPARSKSAPAPSP